MEVNKILKNIMLPRKDREVIYWSKQYDSAIKNLKISSQLSDELIANNKTQVNQLKTRYPFYQNLIDLTIIERDKKILKTNIIHLIISYLEVVYENGNILVEKGSLRSISKKTYNVEKKKILKDLNFILKEAFFLESIKASSKQQEDINISTKKADTETINTFDKSIILDNDKWELIVSSLIKDNVINNKNEWIGLGANLSKPPTQLAVFVYLLEDRGVFKLWNQNKQIPEISEFFNVKLSSARYSQVKNGFKDSSGISKHMMHFPIYEKLDIYIK